MLIVKRITLPGFERVPLYKVMGMLWRELTAPTLILRAKAIAYSFFLALFPTVIFVFSLLAYIPFTIFTKNDIIGYLKNILPNKQMVEVFVPIINDVIARPKMGLLSLGFILIIFFMKNGVDTMMLSFNIHYYEQAKKRFFINQFLSILITLIILFVFLVTIVLIVVGKALTTFAFSLFHYEGGLSTAIIDLLRYILTIGLNLIVIAVLYYMGPAVRPRRFKLFSPGTIVATTMILSVSFLFSFYIRNFANYNKLYGSMGTIILTLIWLNWNALAILIGFELNRSIALLKSKKK